MLTKTILGMSWPCVSSTEELCDLLKNKSSIGREQYIFFEINQLKSVFKVTYSSDGVPEKLAHFNLAGRPMLVSTKEAIQKEFPQLTGTSFDDICFNRNLTAAHLGQPFTAIPIERTAGQAAGNEEQAYRAALRELGHPSFAPSVTSHGGLFAHSRPTTQREPAVKSDPKGPQYR